MAKITALKAQKRGSRTNIYLDGQFAFGVSDNLIVDFDLYVGRELTQKELTKLQGSEEFEVALSGAYRFLSFRPRSEQEVRQRLEREFSPKLVEKTISALHKKGYLNDQHFARFWIENRAMARGRRLLSAELIKKGVAKNIIQKELEGLSNTEQQKAALELVKKRKAFRQLDRKQAYQKVGPFLARRGYDYEIIKKVIDRLY